MSINQIRTPFIKIPRELVQFFNGNRAILAYFEAISDKTSGSSSSLSEVEQRGGIPSIARTSELEKDIEAIVSEKVTPLRARIAELEKQVDFLSRTQRNSGLIEITKTLEYIDASYRPRS